MAFVGAVPMPLRSGNNTWLGVQVCDFITLERARRQGLNALLAGHVFEAARKAGVDLLFAMHSIASHQAFKRYEWPELPPLSGHELLTPGVPLAGLANRVAFLGRHQKRRIERLLAPFEIDRASIAGVSPAEALAVDYSSKAYMDYRCFTNNHVVALEESRFWLSIDSHIKVGAADFGDKTAFLAGIRQLEEWSRQLGTRGLIFQTPRESRLDRALISIGRTRRFDGFVVAHQRLGDGPPMDRIFIQLCDFDTF